MAWNKRRSAVVDGPSADAKDRNSPYKFTIDQNGELRARGIVPGNYVVFGFFSETTELGLQRAVGFGITMTKGELRYAPRADYLARLSPEGQKAVEEYKKKERRDRRSQQQGCQNTECHADAGRGGEQGGTTRRIRRVQRKPQAKPESRGSSGSPWATRRMAGADAAAKAAKQRGTSSTDQRSRRSYTDAAGFV